MSIRDIQLTNLNEMQVSLEVARYLADKHQEDLSHVARCRLEILLAIQYGCKQLSEWRGYSVECYGNDVNKNIDFLSEYCSDVKPLTLFYNAMHPDCDFARVLIADKEYGQAYELLSNYIDWLSMFYAQLVEEGHNKLAKKGLKELLEHILINIGERVNITDVADRLPEDFINMSEDDQVAFVQRICKVL